MAIEYNNTVDIENVRQDIVFLMAYLLGVREERLDSFKNISNIEERINELNNGSNRVPKIIRSLSILRNELIKGRAEIINRSKNGVPISEMRDIVSVDLIDYLYNEHQIEAVIYNTIGTSQSIANINDLIQLQIEKIKSLFPEYIKWDYIKNSFKMPNCPKYDSKALKEKGNNEKLKNALFSIRNHYANHKDFYPYQVYFNFNLKNLTSKEYGNILFNDNKFLNILYSINDDRFEASEYVIDASQDTKDNIYNFLKEASRAVVIVDCENMDPFKFLAALKSLHEEKLNKIKKIILVNDFNANVAWNYLEDNTGIIVENKKTERIKDDKSVTDQTLSVIAAKECYKNNTDSLIIASSDSDFLALREIDEAKFLFLCERELSAKQFINKLDDLLIPYSFVDDFAQDDAQSYKSKVLYKTLHDLLTEITKEGCLPTTDANELVNMIFDKIYSTSSRRQLDQEKEVFFKNYIKPGFTISITNDNKFEINLNSKKKPS